MNARGSIEDLWDRATPVAPLLDALEAEIRKDIAADIRAAAPKYLDNDVDVHVWGVLDNLSNEIEHPDKDTE